MERNNENNNNNNNNMDGEDESWSQHVEADETILMNDPSGNNNNNNSRPDAILVRDEEDKDETHNNNNSNNNNPALAVARSSAAISDDDDNWSRQVQPEDGIPRMPSSVTDMDDTLLFANNNKVDGLVGGDTSTCAVGGNDGSERSGGAVFGEENGSSPSSGLAPKRDEPTLKEKLVERERQRRVETERARWKRQFALSGNSGGAIDEYSDVHEGLGGRDEEHGSAAGTIGEGSSVAQIDTYYDHEDTQQLPYPMERFLQEQGNGSPDLGSSTNREPSTGGREKNQDQGVIMERFLNEPPVVMVESHHQQHTASEEDSERPNVDRSVSFDMEARNPSQSNSGGSPLVASTDSQLPELSERGHDAFGDSSMVEAGVSMAGNTSVANVSVTCLPPDDQQLADLDDDGDASDASDMRREDRLSSGSLEPHRSSHNDIQPESPSAGDRSTSSDQPRVLRLTAEEIQEMAAIEEASRSNAPPSDRDDLSASSFVAELVTDFTGGPGPLDGMGALSQGTPTTAMESVSVVSGNQSGGQLLSDHDAGDDQNSIDALDNASVSSNPAGSSAGGDVSVTANPPSIAEAPPSPIIPEVIHPVENNVEQVAPEGGGAVIGLGSNPLARIESDADLVLEASAAAKDGVVNRNIRPGLSNDQKPGAISNSSEYKAPTSPIMRRAVSAPDKVNFDLDGFDYDKNDATMSPGSALSGSLKDLPADSMWSPGSRMTMSPLPQHKLTSSSREEGVNSPNDYGAINRDFDVETLKAPGPRSMPMPSGDEREPLIPEIPHEILAPHAPHRINSDRSMNPLVGGPPSLTSILKHAISDIRSESETTAIEGNKEAQEYLDSSLLERAFPERMFALTVTLLVEIPVLLMVSGGSDRLCGLIGRTKYQLLMGFLPLSSAISGNVGLQASTLTTRAISHGHVTVSQYKQWLKDEVGAAMFLGLAMGSFLGGIAFFMSNFHAPFGFTVMLAQFVSILTAGLTGTLAPLMFSFIFERDAGKWGGPMETAIQDIVGSFAMVVMSYRILEFFGPMDIPLNDMCSTE